MINLLPDACRRMVRWEYGSRLLEAVGLIAAGLLAIAVILLAPSYGLVFFETASAQVSLAVLGERLAALETDQGLKDTIAEIKRQLAVMKPDDPAVPDFSALVAALTSRIVSGATIESLVFDRAGAEGARGKLTVVGRADSRQSYLRLLASLESERAFSRIEAPIENLVGDRNIRYTIFLYVK